MGEKELQGRQVYRSQRHKKAKKPKKRKCEYIFSIVAKLFKVDSLGVHRLGSFETTRPQILMVVVMLVKQLRACHRWRRPSHFGGGFG